MHDAGPQPNKGQLGAGVFLFAVLVLLDQVSKFLAPDIFLNRHFAFSWKMPPALMYLIYFGILVGVVLYLLQHFLQWNFRQRLPWLLIVSGALSNVGERLVLGYVRDWIYLGSGIFNLADSYIIAGVLILLMVSFEKQHPI